MSAVAKGKVAALAIVIAATVSGAHAITAETTVGGNYRVDGKHADGSAYSGTMKITVQNRNTCEIERQVGGYAKGICILDGDRMAATYLVGENVGVVFYQVQADGSLAGQMSEPSLKGVATEQLSPVR